MNTNWRGKLTTVDLLELTSLDQLLLILKTLLTFFTKQDTLMRKSTVLSFPLQLVFLASTIQLLAITNFPFWCPCSSIKWCHNNQHNDTQHNGLNCYTKHKWNSVWRYSALQLNVIMLSVVMLTVTALPKQCSLYFHLFLFLSTIVLFEPFLFLILSNCKNILVILDFLW